jgi:ketosteroid isomerase-like protein
MAEPSETSSSAIKHTIEAWSRALVEGKLDAWVTYWTKDCRLMPPRHPAVEGVAQIRDYVEQGFSDLETLTLSDWRIQERADLGVAITAVEWTVKSRDGSTRGKQAIVLKKDTSGAWKVQTAVFNTDGVT